jgi:hypothetical protein
MAEPVASQYQHFVPQFLLRNFSHEFKPPKSGGRKSQSSRRKPVNGIWPNERVAHNLNLSVEPAVICEAPIKRIFGQTDMYRDTSKTSAKQQHIEQMFSRLENDASAIFRKITKSFEQKERDVCLTRDERNLLRKFLFLLKYRGSAFHQRFYHETAESYDADDRPLLHDYMREKGYKRPIDVWLDNLKALMKLDMDAGGRWKAELPLRMFLDDAMWFITHVDSAYTAICTPSDPHDEFILTENSYNVFEGPFSFVKDKTTGKVEAAANLPLHEFAPVSSKLMIVLRSYFLPVPLEDAHPIVRMKREAFRSLVQRQYDGEVKSILTDLPITKARNSYSTVVNGQLRIDYSGYSKPANFHKFYFRYFPISTEQVQTINGIFFDNAYITSRIVFNTKEIFTAALESYLATSCTKGKIIGGNDAELRLAF